ncbi:hypothetical protein [Sphingomonas sp. SRS2]|uniref:hypothetical protein n=1 Tax=Sphingomonas sp. SRS2 TaxID=133190 RepID=UPI0006184943|nr:hypothetical protein [Sphingomonas sp. SRS2]KKC27971.1 hypothetical protein WP12_00380 [Sphingomonas sp. SRS2]
MSALPRKSSTPPPGFLIPIDLLPPTQESGGDFSIRRPSTLESFIPVVGPAWEAAADFQDGNYGSAAFNGAMAVADALPVSPAIKLLNLMSKMNKRYKPGLASAGAMQKRYKSLKLTSPGHEVHHTLPLNGASRTAKGDLRNSPAFLKVLPKEQHRRLTGSFNGKRQYDPVRKIWYGTNEWQKAVPTAIAGRAADNIENTASWLTSPPAQRRTP